jgi:copper chaperone
MHNTPTRTATATAVADLVAVVCQRFTVIGMTCAHCEHAVATEIARLAGVTTAVADATAGTVTITATRELEVSDVATAVADAGYELAR